ncbi:ABCB family ABC transporter ATP-binding protein/permease [Mycetohabitans endofungorum]|uniref:ABCB family ABC transporter ATP-binding protein/permease n=1 Tax=Mycetohabitans endofungorum TaxID=417203 RepID=UPI002B05E37D|nr:ABC transporter ATP-binding protein/permease [Mycetohabitans endofungorum]
MRRLWAFVSPLVSLNRRGDWQTIAALFPYLMVYKGRVAFALACLVGAKLANLGVPVVMKAIVDQLSEIDRLAVQESSFSLFHGVGFLIVAYAVVRLSSSFFAELREIIFGKVAYNAARQVALAVFRHLHTLSLCFHLERQTGGLSRDIERGTRGVKTLVSYSLYNILPICVEVVLVLIFFAIRYDIYYTIVTLFVLAAYITFTVMVTEWRTRLRQEMNKLDSRSNTLMVDSLINYETVKCFGNEQHEIRRYDEGMMLYHDAAVRSQRSLSFMNLGQQSIIAICMIAVLWRATQQVVDKQLTLGDFVLINTFMLQIYIPLSFLGNMYRTLKQSLTDMDQMFSLLNLRREVDDIQGAFPLAVRSAEVRFEHVSFSYEPQRQILRDITFTIAAGTTTAIVGHSGSGKSTLARLLLRFYDVDHGAGRILIGGQDIRAVTQDSLRAAIGIVPQDTVLFRDTIYYNIAYGRLSASPEEVIAAARAAHIHAFIESLPAGYATIVGERGLKLSGGEKQRIAIARTLLKKPPILIFDEATSALDSRAERAIQRELKQLARHRTTLIIAHRLSTITHAQQILVMDQGRIVERGTHRTLLNAGGLYAQMWALQHKQPE